MKHGKARRNAFEKYSPGPLFPLSQLRPRHCTGAALRQPLDQVREWHGAGPFSDDYVSNCILSRRKVQGVAPLQF